jgi:alpha-mannosidase
MEAASRRIVYYTFGNHKHWVDMVWNWGEFVLPASVRDMLYLMDETGAKGNVNFDVVGYEQLAITAPEAFEALKQAIHQGRAEIVGASYGQPYGLFCGGEANVRQLAMGVLVCEKLFGVRPVTWWEEEFDFFPQLPQILRQCGFEYGCLFFQWTWHTPHIPIEKVSRARWRGLDGSEILVAPKTDLCLHQWPEDFEQGLRHEAVEQMTDPLIVQWLELLPTPDWMCRAELIAPRMKEIAAQPEFDIRWVTLSEFLAQAKGDEPVLAYTLDDVFHGMSIGKNGDLVRTLSKQAENRLLSAETMALVSGMLGRPYAQWDVYPEWELRQAWRDLLLAQHHDVDECEGLCGDVGKVYYRDSLELSRLVLERNLKHIAARVSGEADVVVFNPLGWSVDGCVTATVPADRVKSALQDDAGRTLPVQMLSSDGETAVVCFPVQDIPSVGYRACRFVEDGVRHTPQVTVAQDADAIDFRNPQLQVRMDRRTGVMTSLRSVASGTEFVREEVPLNALHLPFGDRVYRSQEGVQSVQVEQEGPVLASVVVEGALGDVARFRSRVRLHALSPHVEVETHLRFLQRPEPSMMRSLQTDIAARLERAEIWHDHPFAVTPIRAEGVYRKKYPTGDWMTSPQFFEEVVHPFTGLNFVLLTDGTRGLQYLHAGNQGFLRDGDIVRNILFMYDAWDEDNWVREVTLRYAYRPWDSLPDRHVLLREAIAFNRPLMAVTRDKTLDAQLPSSMSFVQIEGNVVLSAFYREGEWCVLRAYEVNGKHTEARFTFYGTVEQAERVNMLLREPSPLPIEGSTVSVAFRPHEIITVRLLLEKARKQYRPLDDYRSVWVETTTMAHRG